MDTTQAIEVAQKLEQPIQNLANVFLQQLQSGSQFALEQAPILFQEIIKWGISLDVIWMIISIGIFSIVWKVSSLIKEIPRSTTYYSGITENEALILRITIRALVGVISTIIFFINLADMIQAIVAPRLYLITFFMNLLNNGRH